MSSKESICYRLLKRYGLLVSYSGTAFENPKKGKKDNETFGQWQKRVLGPSAEDVAVYLPATDIAPQTRMQTLKDQGGGSHVAKIFEAFGRHKDKLQQDAMSTTEEELFEEFSTIPKKTLARVVRDLKCELEPSVQEFFDRFLQDKAPDIDCHTLRGVGRYLQQSRRELPETTG